MVRVVRHALLPAVTMNRNLALAVALLLALPAGLAACGDDDDTAAPTETTATDDGEVAADEGEYAKQTDFREGVGAAMKDLRHR